MPALLASLSRVSRGKSQSTSFSEPPALGSIVNEFVAWLLRPAHPPPIRWAFRRQLRDFLVCSNVVYAVVGAVYASNGLPARVAIVAASSVASFVYHLSRETLAGAHRPHALSEGHDQRHGRIWSSPEGRVGSREGRNPPLLRGSGNASFSCASSSSPPKIL